MSLETRIIRVNMTTITRASLQQILLSTQKKIGGELQKKKQKKLLSVEKKLKIRALIKPGL